MKYGSWSPMEDQPCKKASFIAVSLGPGRNHVYGGTPTTDIAGTEPQHNNLSNTNTFMVQISVIKYSSNSFRLLLQQDCNSMTEWLLPTENRKYGVTVFLACKGWLIIGRTFK